MAYCGYVFKLNENNVAAHPNADKLNVIKIYDTQCIVSKDGYDAGQLYVFFPEGGQLSEAYCAANDLVRRPGGKGYLDPAKRNVKTIKLRGEVSEGLIMPLSSLSVFGDITQLRENDTIDTFNGKEICRKYVPRRNVAVATSASKKSKKKQKKNAKLNYVFPEHIDTPQFKFCVSQFHEGDLVSITEKLEGSSGRSAYIPCSTPANFIQRLLHIKPKTVYRYFCGSRRVTIAGEEEEFEVKADGFYGSNDFRLEIHKQLCPHLRKNQEVYYEIVGWPRPGVAPLMGEVDTTCLNDKAFTKKYGKKMIFHYGCEVGTYDFYIYRITEMDDDGDVVVEYSTDQIKEWCAKHGFKMVPILYRGFLRENAEEEITALAQQYSDGESTLAPHWREGCVIRRDNNAGKYDVFKHKNDKYKIMKGLFVENLQNADDIAPDVLEEF